jgi:hypothetical protein
LFSSSLLVETIKINPQHNDDNDDDEDPEDSVCLFRFLETALKTPGIFKRCMILPLNGNDMSDSGDVVG